MIPVKYDLVVDTYDIDDMVIDCMLPCIPGPSKAIVIDINGERYSFMVDEVIHYYKMENGTLVIDYVHILCFEDDDNDGY